MRVQIAICSWNRAHMLERTLEGMRGLDVPSDVELEFLVVDNNSTDRTADVISRYAQLLPVRALHERQAGHCHARNCAISAADGDLLIWTDDDVLVDPWWLFHYVNAAQSELDIDFWGGPIIPHFDEERPTWLEENWELCKGCFAYRDLGNESRDFDETVLPYGANFAVRTEIQKQFEFDTSLGRIGSKVVGDDELELLQRILAGNHRGRWLPQASLLHLIPPERATEQYVADYFVGQGQIETMRHQHDAGSSISLHREWFIQRLFYRIKRPRSPSQIWLTHLVRSSLAKGKLAGLQAHDMGPRRANDTQR